MWGYIVAYIVGLVIGIGLMALMCANGRSNDDDYYNGGIA